MSNLEPGKNVKRYVTRSKNESQQQTDKSSCVNKVSKIESISTRKFIPSNMNIKSQRAIDELQNYEFSPFHKIETFIKNISVISNLNISYTTRFIIPASVFASFPIRIKFPIPSYRIFLRFFSYGKLDPPKHNDKYPVGLKMFVNRKVVYIPGSYVNVGKEPKEPHVPIEITEYCILKPNVYNEATFTYFLPNAQTINEFCILVTTDIEIKILVGDVTSREYIKKENTMKHIKEQLFDYLNDNNDLTINSDDTSITNVNLNCPISLTVMKLPVRSLDCSHFQCFDLESYLRMNQIRPIWKCPYCDKSVKFTEIHIDEYFMEIIKIIPDGVNKINFKSNLTWEILEGENSDVYSDEATRNNHVDVISLDSNESAEKEPKTVLKDDSKLEESLLEPQDNEIKQNEDIISLE